MKLSLILKVKPLLFILLFAPSIYWFASLYIGKMGINPIEKLIRELGEFSLQLLIITLCITPLSKIKILKNIIILRRMVGLFAFFYVCLHLSTYIIIDHFFNWEYILKDIYKRPFITFGFSAFFLMTPLALTSNNISIKKLTFKLWKKIHTLIYIIVPIAALHYYLLTKADKTEPLIYLIIIFILIFFRIYVYFLKKFSLPR